MKLSVAIDGPAGAGKSTIARLLAKRFGLMYINTGSMYRAVTLKAIESGIGPNEVNKLLELIDKLEMYFEHDSLIVNGEDLSEKLCLPDISSKVSAFAAIPEVREKLVYLQQKIADKYGVVMDGRDIGTVVLKNASFKFYLTAAPEERARRRYDELCSKGLSVDLNQILNDIIKRDYTDTNRAANPLTKAEDAIEIDSSALSIEEVVDIMSRYLTEKSNGGNKR